MPISQETADRLLIECNRTCALCRKWLVPLEIHHIVPTEKGGTDDEGNLIVLCRNCHATVGTYNVNHPTGRKFSPSELRERKRQLIDELEHQRSFVNCSCACGTSRMTVATAEPNGSCVLSCPMCGAEVQVRVSDKSLDAQIYMSRGADWGQLAEFLAKLAALRKPTTPKDIENLKLDGSLRGELTNTKTGLPFAQGQGKLDSVSVKVDDTSFANIRAVARHLLDLATRDDLDEKVAAEVRNLTTVLLDDDTQADAAPLLVLRLLSILPDSPRFSTLADQLKLNLVDFDSCTVQIRPWRGRFRFGGY